MLKIDHSRVEKNISLITVIHLEFKFIIIFKVKCCDISTVEVRYNKYYCNGKNMKHELKLFGKGQFLTGHTATNS